MRVRSVVSAFILSCELLAAERPRLASNPLPLPLAVAISTSSQRITLSSDVTLNVDIRNTSYGPVTIFGHLAFGAGGGLILTITDSVGAATTSQHLLDELIPPQTVLKRESYVTLQPNHYLGTTLTESARSLFSKPGRYAVTVSYLGPVVKRYFTGPNPFHRQSGILKSNTLRIIVE
jgi:hypothetical protein